MASTKKVILEQGIVEFVGGIMIKQGLKLLVLCILSIALYYAFTSLEYRAVTFENIHLQCSPTIAEETFNKIKLFCEKNASLHRPHNWLSQLQKDFPIIKNVRLAKENNTLTISVDPHSCKAIVNNEVCIAYDGSSYPLKQFNDALMQQIPTIITSSQVTPDCINFIKNIAPEILNDYNISWHSPYEIYLQPHDALFKFLIRHDHIPNYYYLTLGAAICNNDESKKNNIIDIRFNDQIILFANRGKGNGKGIFR